MPTRQWPRQAFLLSWLGLCFAGIAGAEEPPAKLSLDQQISDALRDMHNRAAELFNVNKDYAGSYRVFQGGLYVVRPLLNHRPDVQQILDLGMQEAERIASVPERAMRLHRTIEEMRAKLRPASKPAEAKAEPKPPVNPPPLKDPNPPPLKDPFPPPPAAPVPAKLWSRLGGEPGVKKVVDKFVTLVIADPKVDFTRGGKFKFATKEDEDALKAKLVAFISSVTDGPIPYLGRSMAEAHKGMAITDEQFTTMADSLRLALRSANVAEADIDELMKKVEATRGDIVGK